MKRNFPAWHVHFINARNLLARAEGEMILAYSKDGENPKFEKFIERMRSVRESIERQADRNFKRGKQEGWMK